MPQLIKFIIFNDVVVTRMLRRVFHIASQSSLRVMPSAIANDLPSTETEDKSTMVKEMTKRYVNRGLTVNTTQLLLNQYMNLKDNTDKMSLTTCLLHHIRLTNSWATLIREPHFICLIKLGKQTNNSKFILDIANWAKKTGCYTKNIKTATSEFVHSMPLEKQLLFRKQLEECGIFVK